LKDGTYWVCAIQWNSNNFHLFKIDERGISNHLIQSVGRIHKKFEIGYAESAGQMCFSSTGDHLGYANNDSRTYSIMSFDTLSGNIEEIITDSISKIPKKYTWNFGCAFSSDGTKFYFNSGYINHTDIYQIDLTDNNLEKIQQLDESTFSMQIGPNGKIYISSALQYNFERWNCVHTIENPNGKGIYAKFKQYGQVVGKSTIGTGIYNYPQTQIPIIKESESIVEEKEFFIPNSFSPNGDGTNDTFNPSRTYKGDITKYFIRIYNRLGNIIYEESNPNNIGWNGLDKMGMKECPLDTYYYYVQINEKVYKGDIILLR
jgi:gliding motility-associated-like protein